MVLGLTGGMGCGKSTAARIFEELGYRRVDSDVIVREQLLPSPDMVRLLTERYGPAILGPDGRIDRAQIAQKVFPHEPELRWLEAQLHPRLFQVWRELLDGRRHEPWVFEVPLLFEKALENWFDFTICVATTSPLQLARLAERGMSQALAEQRISKQSSLALKIEYADFVLLNDGSHDFLREQIAGLVKALSVV